MSKQSAEATAREFEHPFAEQDSGRGFGVITVVVILSLIGLVIWFLMTHNES